MWRRSWLIVVVTTVTTAVAFAGTKIAKPIYEASVTLRVATATSGAVDWVNYNLEYSDRLMNTYEKLAATPAVLRELAQNFDLAKPPKVKVAILANTELMQVSVANQDPALAAGMANGLVAILIAKSAELNTGNRLGVDFNANNLDIVDPAVTPEKPIKPKTLLILPLGLFFGLIGGLGLALFFENLDTTVYTSEQIEALGGSVALGWIPAASKQSGPLWKEDSPQREAFRRLYASLFTAASVTPPKTLLVTSAEPGEGKSTVVANLALAMAHSGRRVLVVDCDLRLPTLHTIFGLPNETGLSSILADNDPLGEATIYSPLLNVQVLTSGPPPDHPWELLSSRRMKALLEHLGSHHEVILLDTPALLAVADTTTLIPHVDKVLLVVSCARAREATVKNAYRQLAAVATNSTAVIVNRAPQSRHDYRSYYRRQRVTAALEAPYFETS